VNVRSLVLLLGLVIARPVAAQPADAGEAAYQEGRKAYDLREWDKAIEKFKEAYRIRADAPSLFNIAQSYRLKGDCVEAIGFYKTYKRNFASAPNLAAVDKFIAELEPCAKERVSKPPDQPQQQTTEPAVKPAVTQPQPQQVHEPMPLHEDTGKGKRMTGLIVGGVGIGLVGTGFVFGMLAKGKATDVTNGGDPQNPPEFDKSLEDSGKRFDLLAKISWGVGGAAVVGGVVLFVMGRSASDEPHVSVAPTHGGTIVGWSQRF